MDANDPTVQAIFSAVRSLFVVIGTVIVGHGLATDAQWEAIVGAVTVVLPALWGIYVAVQNYRHKRDLQTEAFRAGVVHGTGGGTVSSVTPQIAHEAVEAMAPDLAVKP